MQADGNRGLLNTYIVEKSTCRSSKEDRTMVSSLSAEERSTCISPQAQVQQLHTTQWPSVKFQHLSRGHHR